MRALAVAAVHSVHCSTQPHCTDGFKAAMPPNLAPNNLEEKSSGVSRMKENLVAPDPTKGANSVAPDPLSDGEGASRPFESRP